MGCSQSCGHHCPDQAEKDGTTSDLEFMLVNKIKGRISQDLPSSNVIRDCSILLSLPLITSWELLMMFARPTPSTAGRFAFPRRRVTPRLATAANGREKTSQDEHHMMAGCCVPRHLSQRPTCAHLFCASSRPSSPLYLKVAENRVLTSKTAELRRQGLFIRSSPDFYKTDWVGNSSSSAVNVSNANAFAVLLSNPDTGAGFYITRQTDSTST